MPGLVRVWLCLVLVSASETGSTPPVGTTDGTPAAPSSDHEQQAGHADAMQGMHADTHEMGQGGLTDTGEALGQAELVLDHEDDDGAPQCVAWAEAGECIRNPQYMFAECGEACNSLVYVDAEDDCNGWANVGECEKNPGFMFQRCNASCMSFARRSLNNPVHESRPNPHLDEREHRASTFLPIFFAVLLLLVGYLLLMKLYGAAFEAKQEQLLEAVARSKVTRP